MYQYDEHKTSAQQANIGNLKCSHENEINAWRDVQSMNENNKQTGLRKNNKMKKNRNRMSSSWQAKCQRQINILFKNAIENKFLAKRTQNFCRKTTETDSWKQESWAVWRWILIRSAYLCQCFVYIFFCIVSHDDDDALRVDYFSACYLLTLIE